MNKELRDTVERFKKEDGAAAAADLCEKICLKIATQVKKELGGNAAVFSPYPSMIQRNKRILYLILDPCV